MSQHTPLETKNIDALILCGGMGKRLRAILSDRPKPMAEIGGMPFLDILIDYLMTFGFRRFILCTGYKGLMIEQWYKVRKQPCEVLISEEKISLGTAGAIKNAQSFIRSSPFLVMNGDSLCRIDFFELLKFHQQKQASVSLVIGKADETKGCGLLTINASQQITRFTEKRKEGGVRFINYGTYLFNKDVLSLLPPHEKSSLEYDIFPKLIGKGFYGFLTKEKLIEIGTPEGLKRAHALLARRNP